LRVGRRRRQQLRRFAEEEKRKFKNSTTSASFHIPSFFGILDYDSSWRELDRRAPAWRHAATIEDELIAPKQMESKNATKFW